MIDISILLEQSLEVGSHYNSITSTCKSDLIPMIGQEVTGNDWLSRSSSLFSNRNWYNLWHRKDKDRKELTQVFILQNNILVTSAVSRSHVVQFCASRWLLINKLLLSFRVCCGCMDAYTCTYVLIYYACCLLTYCDTKTIGFFKTVWQ